MTDTEYDTEDDQPQRHSGMDRHEPTEYDPAQLMREITGGDAVDLPPRFAGGAPPSMSSYEEVGERPSWHQSATPEPVARAWTAVEDAVEAAVEAERAEGALTVQQASAERIESIRVTKLVTAGKEAKPSAAGVDWAGRRRHLEATSVGYRQRARQLRAEYEALVQQHREAWSGLLVASLPDSKAATLKALTEAGSMVERLLGDAEAAQALALVPGGSVVPLPVLPVRRFLDAVQALADEISSSAQLGGADLVHPVMTPPYREREQIGVMLLHGQIDSKVHWLAELERREQYRFSSFTRGIPLPKPSESAW